MGVRIIVVAAWLALAGCGGLPVLTQEPDSRDAGSLAAGHAAKLVGAPYRLGGASPATGFDCSGLVHFSFRQAGVAVPRNTEEQLRASQPIPLRELRRGDLVFFDLNGVKKSHVGLYLGDGSFVHAPSSGKNVRIDRVDSPFWKRQVAEGRRF